MAARHHWHLGVIAWLALGIGVGFAQPDGSVHYFADRSFEIPYSLSPDQTFSRLHLHVSTDNGKTYSQAGSSLQREGAFTYTAKSDGWYFFVVQVERQNGTFEPARVNASPPSSRVCIDTEKPKIQLDATQPNSGEGTVAVKWTLKDANLDIQSMQLAYRPAGGGNWTPLQTKLMDWARFAWSPAGAGPFEVRLVVSDKAKNTAEATTQVRGDPSRATPARPGGATPATPPTGDREVRYVNKKTFKLTYAIANEGPSKVKHVEVWRTRDTTSWNRFSVHDAPQSGSIDVTVEAQGRYGFTLRPISGVGRGKPAPQAGELPQIWIEVDETPPVVKLHNVIVNERNDPGTITINWRAQDAFLRDQPITLLISPTNGPDANWQVLKATQENTGTCECKTTGLPFEFFVRIEAVDRAGNKATDTTRETVKVDLTEPDVKDVNVTVSDPASRPPG